MTTNVQQQIAVTLEQAFSPIGLELIDDSAKHRGHAGAQRGAGHYQVKIISSAFSGLSLIKRHQLVYAALSQLMGSAIHALSIKALAPEETEE